MTKIKKPVLTTSRGVLFADDCIRILRNLESFSVDCVFADPPFNLGKDYKNGYRDRISQIEYLEWCEQWIAECCRILKPGGAVFVYATPELAIKFGNMLNKWVNFRHWIALTMKGTYSRGNKLYPAHYALLYYTRGDSQTFNRLRVAIPTCRHCGKEIKYYNGARQKICRLGLSDLYLEVQDLVLSVDVRLKEEKDANSGKVLRQLIDQAFEKRGGWEKITSGGIDWIKRLKYNETLVVRMGVEIQVSARSDLRVRDVVHLRNSIDEGERDAGVIVVPDDHLQYFFTG